MRARRRLAVFAAADIGIGIVAIILFVLPPVLRTDGRPDRRHRRLLPGPRLRAGAHLRALHGEGEVVKHPPGVWTVEVGWTSSRPVRPDEHTSYVHVLARDEAEATLLAAQMVAARAGGGHPDHVYSSGRPGCVMPTRTSILYATF